MYLLLLFLYYHYLYYFQKINAFFYLIQHVDFQTKVNFRDSPQLKNTASNLIGKNRLDDKSDTPPKFKRRNRLEDLFEKGA